MAKKGPIQATSIRDLGRRVGRAESTVRKWIRRDDWPFKLEPPWDVSKVEAWREIYVNADPASAFRQKAKAAKEGSGRFREVGELQRARIQATMARALLTEQRREVEAGTLHKVDACERRRLRQIHEVKAALLDLGRSLANALAGEDVETIETIITERCRQICEEFAAGGSSE